MGIVRPNDDGTFSWLTRAHDQGERPAQYATADEAMNALCAVLGLGRMNVKWNRSTRSGHLFLQKAGHSIASVFRRNDGRGFSFWTKTAGEDLAVFSTESDAIDGLYAAMHWAWPE